MNELKKLIQEAREDATIARQEKMLATRQVCNRMIGCADPRWLDRHCERIRRRREQTNRLSVHKYVNKQPSEMVEAHSVWQAELATLLQTTQKQQADTRTVVNTDQLDLGMPDGIDENLGKLEQELEVSKKAEQG